MISLQTEQCAPAVSPAFEQVGATAGSVTEVCGFFSTVTSSVEIRQSQAEQYTTDLYEPLALHVESKKLSTTASPGVCEVSLSIGATSRISSHREHSLCRLPSYLQVGAISVIHSVNA